ncbi:peptidoglycan editing factor PgeF [Bacillus sp. 31A1R]|uniref:Purine nucleoside phosphorylase n=1 Tax=Robertmurraya mangrovi TaxID=3098077 RepID=A0ABU5IU99_9BACI|nr:peptidoglycan editing factor PgeF [Bacillus sp. 31A1R]MDZ5470714.1 peptidoglycan editing factor PgeF [Bacillus sp. 31A1R]
MEPFVLKDKEYFHIPSWETVNPHLVVGFTTKNGGVSKEAFSELNLGFHVGDTTDDVRHNRGLLSTQLGISLNCWVGAEQTHEIHIEKVSKSMRGKGSSDYESTFKRTDGFFTKDTGVLLTLCYADCVPIYFYAPKYKAIGIAHAGWKGSVDGIAEEMVKVFTEEGIPTMDILTVIGPSICEKCYIVDDKVITKVQNRLEPVEKKPYNLISGNQYYLNLQELNKQILIKSGILDKNIQITNFCTSCHKETFFSHRRDKGKTGRMMSFIGWKED